MSIQLGDKSRVSIRLLTDGSRMLTFSGLDKAYILPANTPITISGLECLYLMLRS